MQMDTSADAGRSQEDNKRQGLITVNDLNYILEPDLSVAVNKTNKKHFFQSASYSNAQRAICILNSGADYIDTRRSYLSFEVGITDDGVHGFFGTQGSACNLIDNITISTRSGDEICRITDFHLLSNMMLPLQYSDEWFKNQGDQMGHRGYVKCITNSNGDDPNLQSSGYTKFIIPMYVLSPFFSYGKLLPAMIMSGLRIEVEFTDPAKAFIGVVSDLRSPAQESTLEPNGFTPFTTVTGYEVKDPYFSLCSVQLSDSIQRGLNEISATNGLELVYTDYERTESSYSGAAISMNTEVRKSCSRALKAFARIRCTKSGNQQGKKDSFRGEVLFPVKEYQWQLGSLYFPQQPVKAEDSLNCGIEAYTYTLDAVEKYASSKEQPYLALRNQERYNSGANGMIRSMMNFTKRQRNLFATSNGEDAYTAVQLQQYRDGPQDGLDNRNALYDYTYIPQDRRPEVGKPGSFLFDQHVISVNLERSSLFNLAGVPVNNSRVLALRCALDSDSAESPGISPADSGYPGVVDRRVLTIFLKYVKLARVFLNNVEVEQ